jgi:hypothetical protein
VLLNEFIFKTPGLSLVSEEDTVNLPKMFNPGSLLRLWNLAREIILPHWLLFRRPYSNFVSFSISKITAKILCLGAPYLPR